MPRFLRLLAALLLAILVVLAVLWVSRRPLSEAVVARWFAGQGVEARYRITAIAPGGVTLEDVALGPTAGPEFTAERVEATVGWSPLRPRIAAVTLTRPRLRARIDGSGFSLGSLDRLLPKPGAPARPLPDIDVRIVGGELALATPAGAATGSFDGAGRLAGGFSGRGRIAPGRFALSDCNATVGETPFTVATTRAGLAMTARAMLPAAGCAQAGLRDATVVLTVKLPPKIDRYTLAVDGAAAGVEAAGIRAGALSLHATAAAPSLGGPLAGRVTSRLADVSGRDFVLASTSGAGSFGTDANGVRTALTVAIAGGSARPDLGAMRRAARSAAGTLAEPLLAALTTRGGAALRSFSGHAQVAVAVAGGRITLSGLELVAASGARLEQAGTLRLAGGAVAGDGRLTLTGGGLPRLTLSGRGDGQQANTTLVLLAPWSAAAASVRGLRIEAMTADGATLFSGTGEVSGLLGGGVTASSLRFNAAGQYSSAGLALGTDCATLAWSGLRRGPAEVAAGQARICPGPGWAVLSGGRLAGRVTAAPLVVRGTSDGTPFSLRTAPLTLTLSGRSDRPMLALPPTRLDLRYGARGGGGILGGTLDLASFSGSGRIEAARLDDPALPVAVGGVSGAWRLAGGVPSLSGGVARVVDRSNPARFEPLRIDGIAATLTNGIVDVDGTGRLAAGGARLFQFTARHDVAAARGAAEIETGTLSFNPDLQPFQISEALRGVVETVRGPVRGNGRVTWAGDTLASTGTLAIDHVSLATAALGPVDDVAGTLAFDDLLAMTTPPGQRLTIKRINPGVAVDDGVAVFRLLGPDAAEIESIRWPYAGGTLTLAPVTIRAADTAREFLLIVDGLDAQLFLQRFEIKDVNVTGTFDGRLPMVFADGHGRIAGGTLVARAGGGLVQYVGAVGGEDLGAGARLAFDALRRLRYKNLSLDLDGDLDGELVTQLRFTGTNEAATTLGGGPLPIRATGLPFKFNVTVRAPFRALLGTASSFSDVRPLIRPAADGVQPR